MKMSEQAKRSVLAILLFFFTMQCRQSAGVSEDIPAQADASLKSDSVSRSSGIVYFSFDNGLTWQNQSKGLPLVVNISLGAIAVSGDMLALATREGGIYFFDTSTNAWQSIPTEQKILEEGSGPLIFHNGGLYFGTKGGGVFFSADKGQSWQRINAGLQNLTIRRFAEVSGILYAGTNVGLYSYDDTRQLWQMEYGNSTLQVNAIMEFGRELYIATNQGAFATTKDKRGWKPVLTGHSLHNIGSDGRNIYALTYSELFVSRDTAVTWISDQKGLPAGLYTFNVKSAGSNVLAGQWDGVYRKAPGEELWIFSSTGLPQDFAITNMQVHNGVVVVSGAKRDVIVL